MAQREPADNLRKDPNVPEPVAPRKAINVYDRADYVLDELLKGSLSPDIAGKSAVLMREQNKHIKAAFDMAKETNRLREGSPVLPDFEFVAGDTRAPAK